METTVKQTKNYTALVNTLKGQTPLTENQVKYMMKILNHGSDEQRDEIKSYLNDSDFDGALLSIEQQQKGYDWLINQWKTPRGGERKNNPFGYREQEALETFSEIQLNGYYDAGNRYVSFNVPVYSVYGKDGFGFQYYVSGGQINIIG